MPRASAGAHVDAYFAYNALVGEADADATSCKFEVHRITYGEPDVVIAMGKESEMMTALATYW